MSGRGCIAAVIRTGCANLASVRAGLARAGVESRVTDHPAVIEDSRLVVLPGVGAFGPAMRSLRDAGLDDALRRRIEQARPLLAICLGLQMLCDASEESPGVAGLRAIEGNVTRFTPPARVPQLGWNLVEGMRPAGLVARGYAYFANSYKLDAAPPGWTVAWASHGAPFIAALQRGPVLACQFHPELSGAWGLDLLTRWARAGDAQWEGEC